MDSLRFLPSRNVPDIGQLVEGYISKERGRFEPGCPTTIEEIRSMVETYTAILKTCTDVLDNVHQRPEETAPSTALEEIEIALQWKNCWFLPCLSKSALIKTCEVLRDVEVDPAPTDHHLLFRAARFKKEDGPRSQSSKPFVSFDDTFRRGTSVQKFIAALAKHLGKTQLEKKAGCTLDTMFSSMSPKLEWTIHRTGQGSKPYNEEEVAGLVIYDLRRLRMARDVTVFRVRDIIQFLKDQGLAHLIEAQFRCWAENCDEYVTIGDSVRYGMVRWVSWTELYKMRTISYTFVKAYTLAVYQQWKIDAKIDADEVSEAVGELSLLLGGEDLKNVLLMVNLILKPGLSFWGFRTKASDTTIDVACRMFVFQRILQHKIDRLKLT
jgi:hypothetical protein